METSCYGHSSIDPSVNVCFTQIMKLVLRNVHKYHVKLSSEYVYYRSALKISSMTTMITV